MKTYCAYFLLAVLMVTSLAARAAKPVFSGPQIGEKTTPFRVTEITGPSQWKERDPVTENAGAPTALVFICAIERSIVPLLRVVDQYGAERTNQLKTELVFLFGDRVAGEVRCKAVANSVKSGRDHWPRAGFVCLAGRGVKGGQVIGATNTFGEVPAERPISPPDLAFTILHPLGVDPTKELITPSGRPVKILAEGNFISELV